MVNLFATVSSVNHRLRPPRLTIGVNRTNEKIRDIDAGGHSDRGLGCWDRGNARCTQFQTTYGFDCVARFRHRKDGRP